MDDEPLANFQIPWRLEKSVKHVNVTWRNSWIKRWKDNSAGIIHSNLQHEVFTQNMTYAMQCRCYSICIPEYKRKTKQHQVRHQHSHYLFIWSTKEKQRNMGFFKVCITHISSTHPKALSVSWSSFILKETFTQVGAISSNRDWSRRLGQYHKLRQ